MKYIKKYPLISVLIVANLIFVLSLMLRNTQKRQHLAAQAEKSTLEAANRFDKAKFFRKDDYLYFSRIGRNMHDTGRISDAELEWCLKLLNTNPDPNSINGKIPMQIMVSGPLLMYVKEYTPHQKDMMFAFASQLLQGDGGTADNDYLLAFSFMEKTEDKRIVPFVLPHLNNEKAKIKQAAKDTLIAVGESSQIKEHGQ